jgi:hypothetical protein
LLVGAIAATALGCFATDPAGVVVEQTGAFIVEGNGRLTDLAFDGTTGNLVTIDAARVTEVSVTGDVMATYDLGLAETPDGVEAGTFEAVGVAPDGDVLVTSSDANGWRLSRASLALDWYFCLDRPDQPHGVEVWSNGGVGVDAAGLAIYTMPSLSRDNTILTSDLELYDMTSGNPVEEADLVNAGVRSTGVAFIPERGTLLVSERNKLLEVSTDGRVLSRHDLTTRPGASGLAGVAYDAATGTVFLIDDADARRVTVNSIVHW